MKKLFYLVLLIFFVVIGSNRISTNALCNSFDSTFVSSFEFRSQILDEEFLNVLIENTNTYNSNLVAEYMLLSIYDNQSDISELKQSEYWYTYLEVCEAIWNDLEYFPVSESTTTLNATVSYIDTWGESRTYGGERLHEGTDIIANIDEAGYYPIISVSDGIVTNIGWLEQGGYRVGITSPSGAYFYYAHLDSYSNIQEGDEITAGQLLGYMGDSGYGEEGTTGMFPVHLHFGIYINVDQVETSINPYWILRFLETEKLKYSY